MSLVCFIDLKLERLALELEAELVLRGGVDLEGVEAFFLTKCLETMVDDCKRNDGEAKV